MSTVFTIIIFRLRLILSRTQYVTSLAIASVCLLAACDGAVQLCGQYACVSYQNSCRVGRTCSEPTQCEAAGSIRDRAPRIINELRDAQRACSAGQQPTNIARLVWDENLASASVSHARDIARNRFESFTGSDGSTSEQRVDQAGFNADLVLESVGTGPQTAAEMINFWLDIQTDCNQMLTSDTSRIGMACSLSDEADRQPYWSLLLAEPDNGNAIQQ